MTPVATRARFPKQIAYIVGNEAGERFSFYGMKSILVIFAVQYLMMAESQSKAMYHAFVTAAYFTPLLGGFIADRFLGKYKTIVYLSILYCFGHAAIALWENQTGLYVGLALIALGAGAVKPCASAFAGDQFDESNRSLLDKLFELWYFSINLGAFTSMLLIPVVLAKYGPSIAFGIPGVLMALATFVFWMGRKHYTIVPPTGAKAGPQFVAIVSCALSNLGKARTAGQSLLDTAKGKFDAEKVEGVKASLAIMKVFAAISVFWALFDQTGSTWTLQAAKMDLHAFGFELQASQIQSLNAIFVLIMVPLFSLQVYPRLVRAGVTVTPLRKMGMGMLCVGVSFLIIAVLQNFIDAGVKVSVGWQIPAYIVLTASEIMVSISGLEFAYTQAPRSMKSTITSFWLLTTALGNFLTAVVSYMNPFQGALEFYFYAGLMFLVTMVYIYQAKNYQIRNYVESAHIK